MEIENTMVYGLDESIHRSGMPMRLGAPSDVSLERTERLERRALKLSSVPSGSGHDNFMKGIIVQMDVKYPQYWTPQFQRYNFADIISSQSKMHCLCKPGTIDGYCNKFVLPEIIETVDSLIDDYNKNPTKRGYMYVISNLPMGYELWMGISTNYLQLKTIYKQRSNHKLTDWIEFCEWIKGLPMSKLITGEE